MDLLALKPAAYRHVVFPPSAPAGASPINFAVSAEPAPLSPPAPSLTPIENESFLRWVFERAGLDARDYKSETLRRRLPACLRALRAKTLEDARLMIQQQPRALKTAMGTLMIGVTGFFRDPAIFSALGERFLPEITARGSKARVWSVGCSDGQELYSVAVLLAEMQALHRCRLLGTDCRSDAVRAAGEGAYDRQSIGGVPEPLLAKYFTPDGTRWRIHSWLRNLVQWRGGNALAGSEPGSWDMILCRNVSIYLLGAATLRLWNSLAAALRPGGLLVVGKAERPLGAAGLSAVAPCVYRRA
ncbi:MAG: methyltransferase, CheR-type [Phycisphaerales bacterium]|nr:methyltransferase, CheR-type [Phycisphaerales bacterium]